MRRGLTPPLLFMIQEKIIEFVSKYDETLHSLINELTGVVWTWVGDYYFKYYTGDYTLVMIKNLKKKEK